MKKTTKTALIVAASFIAVGAVLMGAGAAAGGAEQLEDGDFRINVLEQKLEESGPELFRVLPVAKNIYYSGEKETKGQEVLRGDFTYQVPYSGTLNKLETKAGIHELTIVEGSDSNIYLEGEGCGKVQCYVEKGSLYIKDVGKYEKWPRYSHGKRKLTLTVPAGISWDEAELEAQLGSVLIDSLAADEAELDASMGNIEIQSLTARKMDADAEMGTIIVENAALKKLEADASMGDVKIEGTVEGSVEVTASMGSVILTLRQPESDFNFEITADMGSVSINGNEYTGLSREKTIDNRGSWEMELDSSMGSIEIFFE